MTASAPYGSDLARVHDLAFGGGARDAAPFLPGRLGAASGLPGVWVYVATRTQR